MGAQGGSGDRIAADHRGFLKPPMNRLSPKAQRELSRFLKFCVVGVIGAVVDFGTFNLLANVLHVWSIGASMASFTAAVCSNFLWNRYWTYPDSRSKQLGAQLFQFALVS
ncbi:MAG TPA: GtrA family protein, partial [Chloroflexi bacterium]|nr:GtrA family protein [Chloroflexota bacterium]